MIGLIEDAVAPPIVSASCWKRIERAAALLSADISGFLGLERRLNQPEGEVDFAIHVARKTGGETILLRDIDAGGYAAKSSAWRRVRDFAALWNAEGSAVRRGADNVWLEFDTAGEEARPSLPEPNLFFGPREGYCEQHGYRWVIDEALPAVTGSPLRSPASDAVERAFGNLPPRARVFQIGSMLARPVPSVRLCVRGMSAETVGPYLDSLGWKDDEKRLESLIDDFAPFTDWIDYDIDLIERNGTFELGPKIGFEGRVLMEKQYSERWKAALEKTGDLGLCRDELRAALLASGGLVMMTGKTRRRWPENLRACDAYLSPGYNASLALLLHHLKLVYDKDAPKDRLTAKVYLAAKVYWRSPGTDSAAKRKLRERLLKEAPKESLPLFFRTEMPDLERIAASAP